MRKHFWIFFSLGTFGLFGSNCGHSQKTDPQTLVDSIVSHFHKANLFNGSIRIVHKGKILLDKGYGFADYKSGIQNSADHIYQIGSITKQFTAAIIMKLHEEGRLNLQDSIVRFFPSLKNSNKITIHHLLTHRSGLFNYTRDTVLWYGKLSEKILSDFLNSKPQDFEPGKNYAYSNSGYALLGYIIEKVTGKKYEQVVREWIFQPLQMKQSGFDFVNLRSAKRAKGYYDNGTLHLEARIIDSTLSYSAGAIYSTTGDLWQWIQAVNKRSLLKSSSWDVMLRDHGSKYGYGFVVDTLHGKKNIWHNGGIDGFVSNYFNLPAEEITIISLSNYMQSDLLKLGRVLAAAILEKPYKLPDVRKEIAGTGTDLQQYKGVYELVPGFEITITVEENKLMAQATDQDKYQIYQQEPDKFFYKVVDAQISFQKDSSGKVVSLTLFQNGQELKGKRK